MAEGKRGYRQGSWKAHEPWPLNLLERIVIWPDGCWSLERANAGPPDAPLTVRATITNEETGTQEVAYQTVWRLFTGREPPRRDQQRGGRPTHGLFAVACGNQWCMNPDHRQMLTFAEGMRLMKLRTGTFSVDPYEVCPRGHSRAEFGYRSPSGKLRCRKCENENRKAHRQAKPEMARAADDRRKARRRAAKQAEREADALIEAVRLLQQPPQ